MAHFDPLTTYACAGLCSAWSSLMSLRVPLLQEERPPHSPREADGRKREDGLVFTINIEDKRDHLRSPLDVPHVRSQTTLPGHARLDTSFPMCLFGHSHKATH